MPAKGDGILKHQWLTMQDWRDERVRRCDYLYAISEILAAGRWGVGRAERHRGVIFAVSELRDESSSMHNIRVRLAVRVVQPAASYIGVTQSYVHGACGDE